MSTDDPKPPIASARGLYNSWDRAKQRARGLLEPNERPQDGGKKEQCFCYITVDEPCTLRFTDRYDLWNHTRTWHLWEVDSEANYDALYEKYERDRVRPGIRLDPRKHLAYNHLYPNILQMTNAQLDAASLETAPMPLPSQAQATPVYGSQATSITTHPAQERSHHTYVSLANDADRKLQPSMMQPSAVHGSQVMSHPHYGQLKYDATQKWQPQNLQTTPVPEIQTARSTDRSAHGHVKPMYKTDPGSWSTTQQIAPVHGPQTYQNTQSLAHGTGQSAHGTIESQPRIAQASWDSGPNAGLVPPVYDSSLPALSHPRTHGPNHRIPSTGEESNSCMSADDFFDAHWAQVSQHRQAPLPDSSHPRTHGSNHRIPNTGGTSDADISADDLFDAHWAQVNPLGQPALQDDSHPHTHTQGHRGSGHHTLGASSVHSGIQSPMAGLTEQLQTVYVSSPGQISSPVAYGQITAPLAAGHHYLHSAMQTTTNMYNQPHAIHKPILMPTPTVHSPPPNTDTGHIAGPSRSMRSVRRAEPYPTQNAGSARHVHSAQSHPPHNPAKRHESHPQ